MIGDALYVNDQKANRKEEEESEFKTTRTRRDATFGD